MNWNLEEALSYYQKMGAPGDQNALISLLKEIQQENGGSIPVNILQQTADAYGVKISLLQAIVRRIPSLRLSDRHILELCAGPNCGRHTRLAAAAEQLCKTSGGKVTLRYTGCLRMCGKGPNLRWDGKLYHKADEALLGELFSKI